MLFEKTTTDTTVRKLYLEDNYQIETPSPVAQTLSVLDKQDIAPSPHLAETFFILNSDD